MPPPVPEPKLAGLGIRPELLEACAAHTDKRLVLVKAPAGSGKTTLLRSWQAQAERAQCWLDLEEVHTDLAIFAEEFALAVRERIGPGRDGGSRLDLLRALPHLERLTAGAIWRYLRRELAALATPMVVFLDNYHRLGRGSASDELVGAMLRDDSCPLRFVIATRGAPPLAAARLLAEGRAIELDRGSLKLDESQVRALLEHFGSGADEDTTRRLLSATEGWVTGILLAARGLARTPTHERKRFVEALGTRPDLFEYVAGELLTGEAADCVAIAETAALLGPCARETLTEALAPQVPTTSLQAAIDRGLVLESEDSVFVHHLWEALLLRRLRERSSRDEWRGLHARLGTFVCSTDPRRAVAIFARGEAWSDLIDLLGQHGREWLNLGRDEFVTRHLSLLPDDLRRRHAEIEYLEALALRRRDVDLALDALMRAADRFRAEQRREAEVGALFDAQILAANRNRRDRMVAIARRVLSLRRLATDARVRAISLLGLAFAALLTGRVRVADSVLRRVNTRVLAASERASAPLLRLQLLRHLGRWTEALELIEAGLADGEIREHAPSVLMFELERALIEGHRDPEAEEAAERARHIREELAAFGLTLSEAMAREVVGLLESRCGRHGAARAEFARAGELAESITRLDMAARMQALVAREHLQERNVDAARLDARHALALFEQIPIRELRVSLSTAALLLPARILAECGEVAEAQRAAQALVPAVGRQRLALADFAAHVLQARIADLAEDEPARRRHLDEAAALIISADLCDAPPELEPAVLRFAARVAGNSGIAWPSLAPPAAVRSGGWSVGTLGGLRVAHDGVTIPEKAWRGATTRRLLLRILCAGPGGLRREALEAELWPEHPAPRAQANLRVALSRLRAALAPHDGDAIRIEGDRIDVSAELRAGWDVHRLERALEDDAAAPELLKLYRGSFAPEIYDAWADPVRGRADDCASRASQHAIETLRTQGDVAEALALVATLVERRPEDEMLWSRMVELRLETGDAVGARRALADGRTVLARELGVPPDAVLEDVAQRMDRPR